MSLRLSFIRLFLVMAVFVSLSGCFPAASPGSHSERSISQQRPEPSSPRARRRDVEPRKLFANEAADGAAGGLDGPVVERGTGRVIGRPSAAPVAGVKFDNAGDITLNVVNADIRDVVRLVLEDGLKANYVIDPAVAGTITVRTSWPVAAKDVIGILNSVLNLNGAALIQQGGLFKVVPLDRSIAGSRPETRTLSQVRGVASGIQVVPLRYADAHQLAELLQPFVANQGSVQVDAARNTLLLIGSADQVSTMGDLIDIFDVDWMTGFSFGLYPLVAARPTELADELDQVFGEPTGGLRLVPIERLSALLVIAAQPEILDRAENWIKRLDKAGDGEGDQVYVYAVQNGRAADLASVLGELFDIQSTAVGQDFLVAPGLEPVELGSSLPTYQAEGSSTGDTIRGMEELQPSGSRQRRSAAGGSGSDRPRPDRLHLDGLGFGGLGQLSLTQGRQDSAARIVADQTSNALLIRATANEYQKIKSALRELDKQPLQVLLEATIAEVSLRDELSYGVQWFFSAGESGVSFSDRPARSFGELFPTGFTGLLSRGDVRLVLQALDTVSEVNVISSPQVLVLDNQTAQLEVGDEVPIVTQQAEGIDTSNARIVNTIEQRQTGVILNVTPRVNASGLVVLDIDQEVSDVVRTESSGIDSPTFSQRRIGTSVAVGSDQTVVLGGLIQDNVEDAETGIPYLKDIPLVGFMFGATIKRTERTELLVLITPKVLTNQQEAVEATEELRRRLRAVEPLQAKVGNVRADVEGELRPQSTLSAPAPAGNFVVQLTSLPSEAEARRAWDGLQRQYAEELRGLEPIIKRTEQGAETVFGLQAGWFNGFMAADRLCAALISRGADCLVIEKR